MQYVQPQKASYVIKVLRAWDYFNDLFDSMPNRINATVDAKGFLVIFYIKGFFSFVLMVQILYFTILFLYIL